MRCSGKWLLSVGVSLALVLAGVSCTSQRLGENHRQMREELLNAYDQQLLDNLIRAKRGEPLLHIRYGEIKGTSSTTTKLSGTIADQGSDRLTVANDSTLVEGDDDSTSASVEVTVAGTMEVVGTPVLDDPDLYKAYRTFAQKFLQEGHDWSKVENTDEVLLHGTRRDELPGGGVKTRVYWLPFEVDGVSVRHEMAALVDRTMFTQKKAEGGLSSSVGVVVLSAAELAGDEHGDGEKLIQLKVQFAPAVRMVYGQVALSESKTVSVGGGKDNHTVSTKSATLMIIPEKQGDLGSTAQPRTAKLYASRDAVRGLVNLKKKQGTDETTWLIKAIEGKELKMSYLAPSDPMTDLNEMVRALTEFLKRP